MQTWCLKKLIFNTLSQFNRQAYRPCPSNKCSKLSSVRLRDVRSALVYNLVHVFLRTEGRGQGAERDWINEWNRKKMYSRGKCFLLLFLHPDGGFDGSLFLRRLCFSSTSHHLNTVSLSVPSLPDGPWPSQPYLHLLAGPTSYHRGRLLAGNTRLHSLWSFIFYWLLSTEMRVWKNPYRAALSLSVFFYIYIYI